MVQMIPRYDAIVVGLGAAGSAALYHLAKQGLKVTGRMIINSRSCTIENIFTHISIAANLHLHAALVFHRF